MDIIATELCLGNNDGTEQNDVASTSTTRPIKSKMVHALDIEAVNLCPMLPNGRKWAIRFKAGDTVTIVLGMKSYGRGWFSGYFAGLVAARLGIPLRRVRVYYSADFPAALVTPQPPLAPFRRGEIGPVPRAVADVIEAMCDEVIKKGRLAFAAMANVSTSDVGFDQLAGRFFVLDRERSGNFLELAKAARGGSFGSTEFTAKLRPSDRRSIAEKIQESSAA